MKNSETLNKTIYNYLLNEIKGDGYKNGERLPSEMELAERFRVSRITTKNALNSLVTEGLVVRIPGRGTFVRETCAIPAVQMSHDIPNKYIALVMGGYSSSFGFDIIYGALRKATEIGLNLVVKDTVSQEHEAKIISSLIADGIAGIIIQPYQGELYSETILKAIYESVPITMIDRNLSGINIPFVGVNNHRLAKMAVTELINNNHRNIALIAVVDEKSSTILDRMNGFTDAFVDKLLVVNKGFWIAGLNTKYEEICEDKEHINAYDFMVDQIAEHLTKHPEITAVFGTEYIATKAACDAIDKIHKRIPQDISVVSFDSDSGYVGSYRVSYVRQPQNLMGSKSVEILYELMQHYLPKEQHILLDGEWIEGQTVRKL